MPKKFLRLPPYMRAVEFPVELIIIKHARGSRYNETRKLALYSDSYISDIIIRRVYKRLLKDYEQ